MEPDAVFLELANHRIRVYENIASDALTILSIQLFIVPVSLSVISLSVNIALTENSKINSASELFSSLTEQDALFILFAAIFAIVAVCLTTASYYIARKRAAAFPNYIIERYVDRSDDVNEGELNALQLKAYQVKKQVSEKYELIVSDVKEDYEPDEWASQTFGAPLSVSDSLRSTLVISLSLTIVSLGIVLVKILKQVYPPIEPLSLYILIVSIFVLNYYLGSLTVIQTLEHMVGPAINLIISVVLLLIKTTFDTAMKFIKYGIRSPKPTVLLLIYFCGLGIPRIIGGFQTSSMIYGFSIPFFISFGLFGLLLLISAVVRN